jgi:hypothetical protein
MKDRHVKRLNTWLSDCPPINRTAVELRVTEHERKTPSGRGALIGCHPDEEKASMLDRNPVARNDCFLLMVLSDLLY